ncbi:MAG TPA: LysR family transcriptional regulator [Steroidobacteraceae bacterium]|jgi:LysR family transcriptional regulator of gallate degradation|nr:LysR family transcriptional regulator [Steroidobacteraceae bacterium]
MRNDRGVTGGSFPNLQHLLAFREVGVLGSVSAAARAIHRSQPAVTQAIAALERRFLVKLFTRTSAGMTLTSAGRLCHLRVERALTELAQGIGQALRGRESAADSMAALGTMSGTQLASLAAVVAAGGFGPAARITGLSRPSLHRSSRALEHKLGVALFEQTSFGVAPTRDAERLARRVTLAGNELAQAQAEIESLTGHPTGRTVIGAMPLARTALLPDVILEFSAQFPRHTLSILDGPYENMLHALREGTADLLVGALREPDTLDDVVQEHLFDDPLAIVMRPGHPLQARPATTPSHLSRFPWIAPRPGSPLRMQFDNLFRSEGMDLPLGVVECNSFSAARAMLQASDRLMLLSAHQISRDLAAGALALLPHPGGNVIRRIGLTLRRGWQPTPTQLEFLRLLRAAAARIALTPVLSVPLGRGKPSARPRSAG